MKQSLLFSLVLTFILAGCSAEKSNESSSESKPPKEKVEITNVDGFKTIEAVTASFLNSISNKDYPAYLKHVITTKMEKDLSNSIEKKEFRKDFISEFGFSIKNEEESFNDLVNYLHSKGIDASTADHDNLEIINYDKDHYAPLQLKEVIVPFPYENYEVDIIFTVVRYNESWYMTSEISL